jgi:putative MATE family efflux protein
MATLVIDELMDERRPSIWRSLIEAIRGTQQDFTKGSISRAVFLLATPMVLEMAMESLFAIVDVFWVTRLGADAVATVGLTESMLTLVFSVAIGVSMSTTAMVARRIGEKDTRGARTAAVQSILLGIVLALSMGLPGFLFARRLLAWMGASSSLVSTGHRYTEIAFGGCAAVMLLFLNNAIFRGAGDASVAMRVLWFANIINLLLDPCLIFGLGPFPALGVTGAAVSTLIGRSSGVLYQFWILLRGHSRIRVAFSDIRIVPQVILSLVRVSVTGVMQFAVAHTSWIVLVRIISGFGSVAVAGYTIGIRIFIFVILPSWGLSGAAATMVGQNLGARKPERAERAVWLTSSYNMLFLGVAGVAFVLFPRAIAGLFTSDAAVLGYAVDCLRIVAWGNLGYAFGMVMIQAFNGAGDTVTPTIINLIGFWGTEVPLAWLLAFRAHMQVRGVFASIPISEALIALLSLAMFFRGNWKTRKI